MRATLALRRDSDQIFTVFYGRFLARSHLPLSDWRRRGYPFALTDELISIGAAAKRGLEDRSAGMCNSECRVRTMIAYKYNHKARWADAEAT